MPRPPLLFIHGAANGAWVWDFWRREMKALGWEANVLDLRGHGVSMPVDFETVTMEDYVSDVESVMPQIEARFGLPPALLGWSMGGLVAMMCAAKHEEIPALVLFEPSPPEQVQGRATATALRNFPITAIGPEDYGLYPDDPAGSRSALYGLTEAEAGVVLEHSRGAQESGLARRQRKSGVNIAAGAIRCPVLVVYGKHGDQFSDEMSRKTALLLGAQATSLGDVSHWGLVYSEEVVRRAAPEVSAWLRKALAVE
jgi:pimeloyl-ACP methyl ester carboxylesterase